MRHIEKCGYEVISSLQFQSSWEVSNAYLPCVTPFLNGPFFISRIHRNLGSSPIFDIAVSNKKMCCTWSILQKYRGRSSNERQIIIIRSLKHPPSGSARNRLWHMRLPANHTVGSYISF